MNLRKEEGLGHHWKPVAKMQEKNQRKEASNIKFFFTENFPGREI